MTGTWKVGRFTSAMAMDAGTSEGARKGWEARAHGQHGVIKVEPTQHGAKYHLGKHQIEVTPRGGFVSHYQEGIHGSFDPKVSKAVFPGEHAAVKKHMAEFGPHPEAGNQKKPEHALASSFKRVKENEARARALKRAGF